jgi:CheY-like chemotaxis protein
LMEQVLEEYADVELLSATRGRAGLELARQHVPDVILLDLHLSDLPGWEVLARLRESEITRDIPVIVISADATAGQIKRLLATGAQRYLTKPIDLVEFARALEETTTAARAARTRGRIAWMETTPNRIPFAAARLPKMKLLILDDEPLNVALLEEMLADGGYTCVKSLTNSREALAVCAHFAPDLILLDLMMPHVDGFAVLEALRTRKMDGFVPVIVLTADVNEETRRRALREGATDFLLKPLDQMEVLLRVGNLLDLRYIQLQLDNQRAGYEEAVRERTAELRDARA